MIPTVRGVGIADARKVIQIDRYSALSTLGTSVAYLDDGNPFLGWKVILTGKYAWVRYDYIDFGDTPPTVVKIKVASSAGATVVLRLVGMDEPSIAQLKIPPHTEWTVIHAPLSNVSAGCDHLVAALVNTGDVQIDWLRFE